MRPKEEQLLAKISRSIGTACKPGDGIRNVRMYRASTCVADSHTDKKRPGKKPKVHKGTQRTCPICNPASYEYERRQAAKAKRKGGF